MSDYYRTQNSVRAFTAQTLTAAFAGNGRVIDCGGMTKLSLDVSYTRGGGETNSDLEIQLESSPVS